MSITKECKSCEEEYLIKENKLFTPIEKKLEKAVCPNCKTELHSENIQGWFYVANIKTVKKIKANKVKFPMP